MKKVIELASLIETEEAKAYVKMLEDMPEIQIAALAALEDIVKRKHGTVLL